MNQTIFGIGGRKITDGMNSFIGVFLCQGTSLFETITLMNDFEGLDEWNTRLKKNPSKIEG